MINQRQIVRLVQLQQFRRLTERILSNGRVASHELVQLLASPQTAAPVALGLALQRVCELNYGAGREGDWVASHLVALQSSDGSFGTGLHADQESLLASTAVALRGLLTWLDHSHSRGVADATFVRCAAAADLALHWLVARFNLERNLAERALGWAAVLWQLADRPELRGLINTATLSRSLESAGAPIEARSLCRYAVAMAA